MEFGSWLEQQLEARQWSQGDLVRAAKQRGHKLASSQLSFAINGIRSPSPETCIAIAEGLNIPREEVFQARGWLLSESEKAFDPSINPRIKKLAEELDDLPFERREVALDAMEFTLDSMKRFARKTQQLTSQP